MFVLLFAGYCPAVQPDEGVPDNRYPEFSWDRLPLYVHIRKATAFTPKELSYLATFPLITFEKTTGCKSYGSTDAGTLEAARGVKAINPRTRILFYRNVFVHYGGYSFDKELQDIDAPFLIGGDGQDKLVRQRCKAYDLNNPALTEWWVKSAASVCSDDSIDGLFIDGNIKVLYPSYLKGTLPEGKKDKVTEGYREMMLKTKAALGSERLVIANIIRWILPDAGMNELNAYFDGSYLENFDLRAGDPIVKGIAATQEAARSGKIIAMSIGLGESAAAVDKIDDVRKKAEDITQLQERIDFSIALFLVCAERYSYFYLHDGYCVDTRNGRCVSKMWLKSLPEYDRPLGPPKGPAKKDGYVYTREFEHCSVRLDVKARTGKIDWQTE